MQIPAEFLDAIRARYGFTSDYKVAKLLGVPPQYVSRWRHGRGGMGDDVAARVAQLLELDVGYVLARLYEERATTEAARSVWRELAGRLGPVTVAVLLALVLVPLLGDQAGALAAAFFGPTSLYYVQCLVVLGLALVALHRVTRSGEARTQQSADRPA